MKKKIAILGSTGSIGKTSLKIIARDKKNFKVELLSAKKNSLQLTAGQSAHLITTIMEGMISRFIRNKFKEIPSGYIENYWSVISSSIFKN